MKALISLILISACGHAELTRQDVQLASLSPCQRLTLAPATDVKDQYDWRVLQSLWGQEKFGPGGLVVSIRSGNPGYVDGRQLRASAGRSGFAGCTTTAVITIAPTALGSMDTMAHELGHVLGLSHHEFYECLMYPYHHNARALCRAEYEVVDSLWQRKVKPIQVERSADK